MRGAALGLFFLATQFASASMAVADSRIRTVSYHPNVIYSLRAFVGYQIDLEFEPGETFTGLAAGDLEGLSFTAQDNHVFLKPKAPAVTTNLTVLTNRRHYHFDYTASEQRPHPAGEDVIYALRFEYSQSRKEEGAAMEEEFAAALRTRPRNYEYAYCGHRSLKPSAASDDGVQTRIRFNDRAEFPAIFVRNEDGTESLLNFNIEGDEVIVHRVARQFIVRRGKLTGCIVNQEFQRGGERLDSGTVSPAVEREPREPGRDSR